ncbi:MAG: hypothetical protein ISN64_01305 [Rickettsia sp.]|nr:hypothetical protein [Rickettsia sp.]
MREYRLAAFTISILFHVIIISILSLEFNNKKLQKNIQISFIPAHYLNSNEISLSNSKKKEEMINGKSSKIQSPKFEKTGEKKVNKKILSSKQETKKNNSNSKSELINNSKKSSEITKKNDKNTNSKKPLPSNQKKINKENNTAKKLPEKNIKETSKNNSKIIDDPISSTLRSLEETNLSNKLTQEKKNISSINSLDTQSIIKNKIEKNWFHQVNLEKNNIQIEILIKILIAKDKTIKNVKVKDLKCSAEQDVCNLLVESAIKAIFTSSPFTELDEKNYTSWKDIELLFNPNDE